MGSIRSGDNHKKVVSKRIEDCKTQLMKYLEFDLMEKYVMILVMIRKETNMFGNLSWRLLPLSWWIKVIFNGQVHNNSIFVLNPLWNPTQRGNCIGTIPNSALDVEIFCRAFTWASTLAKGQELNAPCSSTWKIFIHPLNNFQHFRFNSHLHNVANNYNSLNSFLSGM